jgi:hypothetical protein
MMFCGLRRTARRFRFTRRFRFGFTRVGRFMSLERFGRFHPLFVYRNTGRCFP